MHILMRKRKLQAWKNDGLLLSMRVNPREPAAAARRPLRIRVLAKRVYIYIYIYITYIIHTIIHIYIEYLHNLSLSLSLYIYIYICGLHENVLLPAGLQLLGLDDAALDLVADLTAHNNNSNSNSNNNSNHTNHIIIGAAQPLKFCFRSR